MLYVWRCMCQIIADLQAAHASVRTIGSHFFRWTHLIFARVQTAVVVLSTFKGKVQCSTLRQSNMAMENPLNNMEFSSCGNHGTKWMIFQQTMFDDTGGSSNCDKTGKQKGHDTISRIHGW